MIDHRSPHSLLAALTLAVSALTLACDDATGPKPMDVEATVEFLAVEGGCWSLLASDGTRYEPLELAEPFRQNGLKVVVRVRRRTDVGTVCQVGTVVEILSIEAVDEPLPVD